MLKNFLFAVVALALFSTSAQAADDFLSEVGKLDASSIASAEISIEQPGLDGLDVDALAGDASKDSDADAVEACFRHFGFGYGYNYCYQPYYYHSIYYCYRPVYQYICYPVYSCYWGCY